VKKPDAVRVGQLWHPKTDIRPGDLFFLDRVENRWEIWIIERRAADDFGWCYYCYDYKGWRKSGCYVDDASLRSAFMTGKYLKRIGRAK